MQCPSPRHDWLIGMRIVSELILEPDSGGVGCVNDLLKYTRYNTAAAKRQANQMAKPIPKRVMRWLRCKIDLSRGVTIFGAMGETERTQVFYNSLSPSSPFVCTAVRASNQSPVDRSATLSKMRQAARMLIVSAIIGRLRREADGRQN